MFLTQDNRDIIRFQEIGDLVAFAATNERVLLGVIEITNFADNTVAADKALSFSPNNIPDGIETADPMLNFRSRAYPISVQGRQ